MESEKLKEILKFCSEEKYYCYDGCPYTHDTHCVASINKQSLTLINELESDNERLKIAVDIANERIYRKKFIDEWRKEYQKELDKQGNGHIAGYPDFDLVYKLYFEQKDRIAELEKENKEKLKQFAERLKEKSFTSYGYRNEPSTAVLTSVIDETLKEMLGEE